MLGSTPRFPRGGERRPAIQTRPSARVGRAVVGDWVVGRFGIAEPSGPVPQGAVLWELEVLCQRPRGTVRFPREYSLLARFRRCCHYVSGLGRPVT